MTVERLFGREVIGRAQDILVKLFRQNIVFIIEEPCQTHVEDFDLPGALDEDVARFDIAMHQSRQMGMIEAECRLMDVMARCARHRAALIS